MFLVFGVTITGMINSIIGGSLHLHNVISLCCFFLFILMMEVFSIRLSVSIENRISFHKKCKRTLKNIHFPLSSYVDS